MLRSVCLRNYVKFNDYQVLDFSDGGASYFIGENGSGKSSVLEGIRRCLKAELSTSVSSVLKSRRMSYFICNFEGGVTENENEMDNVICGIVVMPDIIEDNDSESETDESLSDLGTHDLFEETETQCIEKQKEKRREGHESQDSPMEKKNIGPADDLRNKTSETTDETDKIKTNMAKHYKFVMRKSGPMYVNLMQITPSNEGDIIIETRKLKDITNDVFKDKRLNFINAVVKQKDTDRDIKKYLKAVFDSNYIHELNKEQWKQLDDCKRKKEKDNGKTEKEAGDGKSTKKADDRNTEKPTDHFKTDKQAGDCMTEKVDSEDVCKIETRKDDCKTETQVDKCQTETEADDCMTVTEKEDFEYDCKTKKQVDNSKIENEVDDYMTKKEDAEDDFKTETDDGKTTKEEYDCKTEEATEDCKSLLEALSSNIVFTFPLRSIGPLQWSESKRIHHGKRETNYVEAEERCEIIKCYLEDDGTKFNQQTEQDIFQTITKSADYKFELKDDKIVLPKSKYALLKTPEGILEAKAFSILLSGKNYKTIILEEPDRGMHPQYIERMMQVMNRYKDKKRVILTTHNSSLITPWTLPNCFVFKRQNEDYRIISGRAIVGAPTKHNVRMKKLRLIASDHVSDILFAKKVLFFEGDSELLFLTEFRRQILSNELADITIFKDDKKLYDDLHKSLLEVTLIKMNGKGNASFCHEVCNENKLNLGHLIIVDRDGRKKEKETKKKKEPKENQKEELQTKAKVFDGEKEEVLQMESNETARPDKRNGIPNESDNTDGKKGTTDIPNKAASTDEEQCINQIPFKSAMTDERKGIIEIPNESTLTDERKGIKETLNELTGTDEREDNKDIPIESALIDERRDQMKKENVFFWLHGDIEDMIIKLSLKNQKLQDDLKKHNISLDENQYQKKKERSQKLFLSRSVTISNITKAVKCIFEHCTKESDLFQLITYLKCDNWNSFLD